MCLTYIVSHSLYVPSHYVNVVTLVTDREKKSEDKTTTTTKMKNPNHYATIQEQNTQKHQLQINGPQREACNLVKHKNKLHHSALLLRNIMNTKRN